MRQALPISFEARFTPPISQRGYFAGQLDDSSKAHCVYHS